MKMRKKAAATGGASTGTCRHLLGMEAQDMESGGTKKRRSIWSEKWGGLTRQQELQKERASKES